MYLCLLMDFMKENLSGNEENKKGRREKGCKVTEKKEVLKLKLK